MDKILFTGRERQVIQLLMEGKSNKQIAANLHITEGTVEFHLTRIYTRLKVGCRLEAVIRLQQLGKTLDTPRKNSFWKTLGLKRFRLGKTPVEV